MKFYWYHAGFAEATTLKKVFCKRMSYLQNNVNERNPVRTETKPFRQINGYSNVSSCLILQDTADTAHKKVHLCKYYVRRT